MKLPAGLGKLDWSDWVLGLWSALIQGGSSAVLSAVGLMVIDPKDFSAGQHKLWAVAGSLFCWNGFLGMLAFLRTKPAPGVIQTVTTVRTSEPEGTTVKTVQETKVEPIVKP